MRNARKNIVVIGFLVFALLVCSGCLFTAESKAQVSFTYTTLVTQKTVAIGDTAEFLSTLTNTGRRYARNASRSVPRSSSSG